MTTEPKRDLTTETPRPQGRMGAHELLAQVHAATEGEEAAPVSQRNPATKGLRAYFQPLSGRRRTGLVAVHAIRTRTEGQVRRGEITAQTDFPDLVASVQTHGVLQPVGLTWDEGADCFWTDFGHRRIEAARAAGLEQIPAIISVPDSIPLPDGSLAEQQLIENLQRTHLPAIDVAHALKSLVGPGRPAAEVARRIGRSPSWVIKHLKILELPNEVLLEAEKHELGHEALYSVAQADVAPHERKRLLDVAISEGRPALSRAIETIAVAQSSEASANVGAARDTRAKSSAPRALRAAAARALAAAEHLHSLLVSSSAQQVSLQRAAAKLCVELRRFLGE